jgi:tRNA-2-methylthio-N6-dimethylallyladenosine synthase
VDVVFGTNAVLDIPSLVERVEQGERHVLAAPEDGPPVRSDEYLRPGSRRHAWVSIMRGCDNYCSYCVVPYVRGRQRSKGPEEVLEEVSRLAQQGVKEITLLGQNVNAYGKDLANDINFAGLLARLDTVNGLLRIRFTTSHPKDISEDLMRAIRVLHTVCEHLHLPAQSGSSRILQLMNRNYTAEDYLDKVRRLREFVPEISLTTDIIIGFPGETDEDFEATCSLVRQVQFDGAYVFKFSPRQGTAAAEYKDQVSKNIIKQRHHILLDLQKEISQECLNHLLHTIQVVLPEQLDPKRPGHLLGRTRGHRTASFPATQECIGHEVSVQISRIDGWTLVGEPLSAEENSRRHTLHN